MSASKANPTAATSGGRLDVLRGLKFALPAGAVAALVGPSGCGKTTLLRIIAGLDRDFPGAVNLPEHGKLGMVFQEPRLLPWRTVEQNVRLAAPEATDADLDVLFAALGLAAHRAHYPGELSLGLARRVALARAFAVKPDLLVLDEPFVSLDDALAERLRDELADLVTSRRGHHPPRHPRCRRGDRARRPPVPAVLEPDARRRRAADRAPARAAFGDRARRDPRRDRAPAGQGG